MLARLIFAVSFLLASAAAALAQSTSADQKAWYETGYSGQVPTRLKQALADDRQLLGVNNVGYHMQGDKNVCAALRSVKLPCDYNARFGLANFLTYYGRDLMHGTNPYVNELRAKGADGDSGATVPDMNIFVGMPNQNRILAAAVRRNAHLFHGGDLTAEDVRKRWK